MPLLEAAFIYMLRTKKQNAEDENKKETSSLNIWTRISLEVGGGGGGGGDSGTPPPRPYPFQLANDESGRIIVECFFKNPHPVQ